jgi:hypothetical protein
MSADELEFILENRQSLTFVIGFSAPSLIPDCITLLVTEVLRLIYLNGAKPMDAIQETFGSARTVMSHTGVVLFERTAQNLVTASHFVFGPPSHKPWGLSPPACPGCVNVGRMSHSEVRLMKPGSRGRDARFKFHCKICRLKTIGSVERPPWVKDAGRHLQEFYVLPHPLPENLWPGVEWGPKEAPQGSR